MAIRLAKERMPAEKPALQRPYRTCGGILRFFSARGDLRAVFPIVAELADQGEPAGDENGGLGRGFGGSVFESAFGLRAYGKARGVMAARFGQFAGRELA